MDKLWLQSHKSLKRRTTMRRDFIESIKSLNLTLQTETGVSKAFEVPARIYDVVFKRVVRGLYYHHFNEILGKNIKVEVAPLTGIDDISFQLIKDWTAYSIGDNAFVYKVSRASDAPESTVWVMQLYESHWILGVTGDAIQI